MARTVTLAQLRTDARLFADQRPGGASAFINDTELSRLINLRLPMLYDLLVQAQGEDYYSKRSAIPGEAGVLATVVGTSDYDLPDDFYQLISVKLAWDSSDWEELDRGQTLDGHRRGWWGSPAVWEKGSTKSYQLAGARLRLLPVPTTVTNYVLIYVPTCPELVSDTDTFDGVNGWERLIALGTALDMHGIGETDGSSIAAMYREIKEHIESIAHERIAGLPAHVIDVCPEGYGP